LATDPVLGLWSWYKLFSPRDSSVVCMGCMRGSCGHVTGEQSSGGQNNWAKKSRTAGPQNCGLGLGSVFDLEIVIFVARSTCLSPSRLLPSWRVGHTTGAWQPHMRRCARLFKTNGV